MTAYVVFNFVQIADDEVVVVIDDKEEEGELIWFPYHKELISSSIATHLGWDASLVVYHS